MLPFTCARSGWLEPFVVRNSLALEPQVARLWLDRLIRVAPTRGRVFDDLSVLDVEDVVANDPTA